MSSIERHRGPSPDQLERMDRRIRRVAEVLAKTKLVPEKLQGKPDAVEAILTSAAELGIPPTVQAVNQFYVPKDGQVGTMAQLQMAKAAQHGYDVWSPEEECSDEEAVAYVKRPDGRTFRERFTIVDAEKMGLLEVWPDSGKPKKDNWAHAPALMLRYRAITKAIKLHAPGLMLGFEGWGRYFDEAESANIGVDDRSEGARSETGGYRAPPAGVVEGQVVEGQVVEGPADPPPSGASTGPDGEGGTPAPPSPPAATFDERLTGAVRGLELDAFAVAFVLRALIVYATGQDVDAGNLDEAQQEAVKAAYVRLAAGELEPVEQGSEVVLEEVPAS